MNTASSSGASTSRRFVSIAAVVAALPLVPAAFGAALTWDGGGSDGLTSTAANWSTDAAPAATGDTLTFAGTTNLTVTNDSVTSLATSGTALTFASGAGSFNIGGSALTLGSGGGGGQVIISQQSANAQVISANITLSGGNGDRSIVFGSGAGSLTLSGNINFNGDWLFLATTAGTTILSGTNTGDGKTTAAITAGTNVMRAMLRNNIAGSTLVLGSDSALGNSGSGDAALGNASLRGLVANAQLNISTSGGDRDLSGSTLAINANNITFNGTNNLKIAGLVNQAGNRDFVVSSTGQVTAASGIYLSNDQTGRNLYLNLSGTGGMVVDGKLYDTLHNSGLTTAGSSILRKAGTGTLTLNGDSGSTFGSVIQIENGTLKIGHANALGATGLTGVTKLQGGNLDLNGQAIGETLQVSNSASQIQNNSVSAATVTTDASSSSSFTVNNTGDITMSRIVGSANFTITKLGSGVFTTNGSSHNNLAAWNIQAGTVVFANTSGFAADRGVTLTGGTLRLSGANTDLINNDQAFVMGGGTLELNGNSETIGAVTLNDATTSTIDFGSGSSIFLVSSISGTGLLNVLNWTQGADSLRVTADASSVLGQITINGLSASIANMGSYYELSAAAIPEPSSFAALAGLGVLGAAALRRRRR